MRDMVLVTKSGGQADYPRIDGPVANLKTQQRFSSKSVNSGAWKESESTTKLGSPMVPQPS